MSSTSGDDSVDVYVCSCFIFVFLLRISRALKYSCQLREHLKNRTGESPYLRPGRQWYRNVEFGRPIEDPDKRGRYGRPNPVGFKVQEKNPYHYHGADILIDPTAAPVVSIPQLAPTAAAAAGGKGGKHGAKHGHGHGHNKKGAAASA